MIGLLALLLLPLGWLLLRWVEIRLIYPRSSEIKHTPKESGLAYEEIAFMAADGMRLNGWWVPHPEATGTVLVCHGNAGNIGDRLWMLEKLHPMKVNVFLFDYRGYGKSRGWPTEKGCYKDACAAYEVIRSFHKNAEQPPVVIYGRSLGGAIVAQLALEKDVRGLILESTFTSMHEMANIIHPSLPKKFLLTNKYETLQKINQISAPKLMAHSLEDHFIPYSMGEELYTKAQDPKTWCDLKGEHNESGWQTTPAYYNATQEFLENIFNKTIQ